LGTTRVSLVESFSAVESIRGSVGFLPRGMLCLMSD